LAHVATASFFFVFTLCALPSARGDAAPIPTLITTTPSNVTLQEGTPLSMVYQFYNPSSNRYIDNVAVAPIPRTNFYGPGGGATGEFADLASFPGYVAAIGPGQYGQFTLHFITTGIDDGNSASWQLSMPQVSYSWSTSITDSSSLPPFGTPTLTFYETPEPSTLAFLAAGAIGLIGYRWRRRAARATANSAPLDPPDPANLSFPSQASTHAARRAD
jgi:hypothetical protein